MAKLYREEILGESHPRTNSSRGFQRGNPSLVPHQVKLELFDTADRHYRIWITSNREGPAITQPEINAIIASIRPTSQN